MNPSLSYYLAAARVAELHHQAQRDALAHSARQARRARRHQLALPQPGSRPPGAPAHRPERPQHLTVRQPCRQHAPCRRQPLGPERQRSALDLMNHAGHPVAAACHCGSPDTAAAPAAARPGIWPGPAGASEGRHCTPLPAVIAPSGRCVLAATPRRRSRARAPCRRAA